MYHLENKRVVSYLKADTLSACHSVHHHPFPPPLSAGGGGGGGGGVNVLPNFQKERGNIFQEDGAGVAILQKKNKQTKI